MSQIERDAYDKKYGIPGVSVDDVNGEILWHVELGEWKSETKKLHQRVDLPEGVEISVTTLGDSLCVTKVDVDGTQVIKFIYKCESTEL